MTIKFNLIHKDNGDENLARRGQIITAHGIVETPTFMPVGTAGTVKAMLPENVRGTGADVVLGNTYHLMLRPGAERVHKLGGIHKFMNWPHTILTDSGGFQVMSLSELTTIREEGVRFRSHIDGAYYNLTPEESMNIQYSLGSDITMAFDQCVKLPATDKQVHEAMLRSMRWAMRSKIAFKRRDGHGLFGIVQGGINADFRIESAEVLKNIGFDGYAIGGLAVGEGQVAMFETLDATTPHLPCDAPRYLMGVGKPDDIVGAVRRGVDMFDCVLPTRSGRNGQAFTEFGAVNLKNARFIDDDKPLEENCPCPACKNYSRSYLNHLVKSGEILGMILLTWHNISYYQRLMKNIRTAIEQDRFDEFEGEFHKNRASENGH